MYIPFSHAFILINTDRHTHIHASKHLLLHDNILMDIRKKEREEGFYSFVYFIFLSFVSRRIYRFDGDDVCVCVCETPTGNSHIERTGEWRRATHNLFYSSKLFLLRLKLFRNPLLSLSLSLQILQNHWPYPAFHDFIHAFHSVPL